MVKISINRLQVSASIERKGAGYEAEVSAGQLEYEGDPRVIEKLYFEFRGWIRAIA